MVSKEQIISIHTLDKLRKLYYEGNPEFYTVYGQESDKLSKEQKREIVEMFTSSTSSMDEDSSLKKEAGGDLYDHKHGNALQHNCFYTRLKLIQFFS